MQNENKKILESREFLKKVNNKQNEKEGIIIPEQKLEGEDFEMESIRCTFVISKSDLKPYNSKEREIILDTHNELKKNGNFSNVIKKLYFDYALREIEKENNIDKIVEKINEKLQLEKQYEIIAETVSKALLKKLSNTEIKEKIEIGEFSEEEIKNLLNME